MTASVDIKWTWLSFAPSTTTADLVTSMTAAGVDKSLLKRGVYVIRLKAPFGIAYPGGHSPTLYIGEGNVPARLAAHKRWLQRFQGLGYAFPLEVACAFPRVRKNRNAYRDFEAHLLAVFYRRYHTLPLRNSIHERRSVHHVYAKVATHGIIGPGSGTKHTWAIQPLPANSFRTVFQRTHAA